MFQNEVNALIEKLNDRAATTEEIVEFCAEMTRVHLNEEIHARFVKEGIQEGNLDEIKAIADAAREARIAVVEAALLTNDFTVAEQSKIVHA